MSKGYEIEIGKGEIYERKTEAYLNGFGCEFKKEKGAMGAIYRLEKEGSFRNVLPGLILFLYKQNAISAEFSGDDSLEYYAILGCLLSVEMDAELAEISNMLQGTDAVNLDGFYNFDLTCLRSAWKGIARIASKLYVSCRDEEDKTGLLLYLMDLQEKRGKKVTVDGSGIIVDGRRFPILEYVSDVDKNVMTNVFSHRPEFIEIDKNYRLSSDTLDFLRTLGDIPVNSPIDS